MRRRTPEGRPVFSTSQRGPSGAEPSPGYQPETVSIRGLVLTGVGVFVGVGVIAAILAGVTDTPGDRLVPRAEPPEATDAQEGFRHWVDPPSDLARYRAEQEDVLTTYAWTSRDSGLVRVPLALALRKIAAGAVTLTPAEDEP